jgi:hypothetical protein
LWLDGNAWEVFEGAWVFILMVDEEEVMIRDGVLVIGKMESRNEPGK